MNPNIQQCIIGNLYI